MTDTIKKGWLAFLLLSFFSLPTIMAAPNAGTTPGINDSLSEQANNCSRYGPDKELTLDKVSLYSSYFEQKMYRDALSHWRYVYNNAAGFYVDGTPENARDGLLRGGIKIYEHLIENAEDEAKKQAYIDTMLGIYDKRVECFGRRGYVMGRKAYAMMKYRSTDYPNIRSAMEDAIEHSGERTEYFLLYPYLRLMVHFEKKEEVDKETIFTTYDNLMKIIEANEEHSYAQQYADAETEMTDFLVKEGYFNCEELKPYFEDKFAANPDDIELIKKARSMLKACDDCDKTFNAQYIKLFNAEPSAELASSIASCAIKQNNYTQAMTYLKEAIRLTESNDKKANYAYNMASIQYQQKNFPEARKYAEQAITFRPNWGDPYLLIGDLYASSGPLCGSGRGFESQVVVWPAIDMWEKAKSVDPSVSDKANKKISNFSGYMPETSVLFQKEIEIGSTYKVNCWINRSTTVRAKP